MKRSARIRLGVAVSAAATLGATAAVPAVQAAGQDIHQTSTSTYAGIPSAVNPDTDLAAHTPGTQRLWNDSIYFTSWIKAGGHNFGVLVHTLDFPNIDNRIWRVTVTDEDTGWHKLYESKVAQKDYSWSKRKLNIKAPGLTWTGNAQNMAVKAATPWGALNFNLKAQGPALKYAGTGTFDLLGSQQYEYALPSMRTTGTLAVQGKTHAVSGESWLDRQWGPVPLDDKTMHWTWMNLRLPNGDKLAIWDYANNKRGNAWATVVHPDGSYSLAEVKPLAKGAHRTWTSPVSGNSYPTRWSVDIPALKTHLNVRITGTDAQEATGNPRGYEGTAAFNGTYEGKQASGVNYVEMVGNWKA
ncbi:lipocalin family protein [Streptomyces sp. NPDC097640]|uniref:lipocalin family protein n=1 Tax=Streptomyces sp. NPDC097640 TaxID=3157229 RepID=UPI00331C8910